MPGVQVGQLVAEVGSGLTGKRPKLARILSDPSATVIVVEHRDRLAALRNGASAGRPGRPWSPDCGR